MSPSHSRTRERKVVNALVQPILTPRFAIACTDALLAAIAALQARDPLLRIQTHLSENPSEIAFTKSLFPFAESYASVYDHFGLLTQRTILAHAVHLDDSEMDLISKRGCGISHCPTSNLNLRSGCSPLGELLNRGIKVGLGTDVSGGYALSMLTTIRDASIVAKVLAMTKDRGSSEEAQKKAIEGSQPKKPSRDFTQGPLPIATLLYLATLGGAQVCALESKIGSLEPGKVSQLFAARRSEITSDSLAYMLSRDHRISMHCSSARLRHGASSVVTQAIPECTSKQRTAFPSSWRKCSSPATIDPSPKPTSEGDVSTAAPSSNCLELPCNLSVFYSRPAHWDKCYGRGEVQAELQVVFVYSTWPRSGAANGLTSSTIASCT